jgi:hypothetical protein
LRKSMNGCMEAFKVKGIDAAKYKVKRPSGEMAI